MSASKLHIAKQLIKTLANRGGGSSQSACVPQGELAVSKVIEAARAAYVLPSFCAEIHLDEDDCIDCIVEQSLPVSCRLKREGRADEDFDIAWKNS